MANTFQHAKFCLRKETGKGFLECRLMFDLVSVTYDHGYPQSTKQRSPIYEIMTT